MKREHHLQILARPQIPGFVEISPARFRATASLVIPSGEKKNGTQEKRSKTVKSTDYHL